MDGVAGGGGATGTLATSGTRTATHRSDPPRGMELLWQPEIVSSVWNKESNLALESL